MKRTFLAWSLILAAVPCTSAQQTASQNSPAPETIQVDTRAPGQPFPHFWEQMFGSGRAILSLRQSYRDDLREVKSATGLKYVRFHAIFHDEVGIYDEDAAGKPIYNFSYVDQIYDGLLQAGVRPFIELSFMPKKLAAEPKYQDFWYKPNISPPKSFEKWAELVRQFAQHLVDRYGLDEVSQWYFEVWNEPNIDFWVGAPKEQTYFQLYDAAARALKEVSPRLRIGGPATAQAAWADRFIQHTVHDNVPVDFVSTHVYGNDSAPDVFGTHEQIPRTQMVCRAVRKVHDQIAASARPHLPLIWSEFNASYMNEPDVTDSTYMGPWMADTIRQCDGLVDMMSYWTFSDVFEEQGVIKTPFYGGYGVIAEGGVPKAAFNAFAMLHRLGAQRSQPDLANALVTKRADGTLAVAVWNYADPGTTGTARKVHVAISGRAGTQRYHVELLDPDHGSALATWQTMGSPASPTPDQYERLKRASTVTQKLDSTSSFMLPAHGLALIEVRPR